MKKKVTEDNIDEVQRNDQQQKERIVEDNMNRMKND